MSTQGDAALPVLRKTFSFSGYWLTAPPRETHNTWTGKKRALGCARVRIRLVWPGGREASTLPSAAKEKMGLRMQDKRRGTQSRKGSRQGRLYFWTSKKAADLPPQFHSYTYKLGPMNWCNRDSDPGVYCSGIPVNDGNGPKIVTAENIRSNEQARDIVFWVFNDVCPPSPGCRNPVGLLRPAQSGVEYAVVWQFVRSPQPKETAFACAGYANDGNCYAAADAAHRWHLDLDVASSSNPSAPPIAQAD